MGCHPSDVHYPAMKSHVAKHTFNLLVYKIGQPERLKREAELSGVSAISKAFGG